MVCTRDVLKGRLWGTTLLVERKHFEAKLWNMLEGPIGAGILRVSTVPGFDRIPLVQTARHEVILYAKVLRIEEFRMILRVMLNTREPNQKGSGPPEKVKGAAIAYDRIYPDPEAIYRVNDQHLALLVAAQKAGPEDAGRLCVVHGTFFHNYLVPEGLVKIGKDFKGAKTVEFYGGLVRGVLLPNLDKDDNAVVVLRLEPKYCLSRGAVGSTLPPRWHEGIVALHLGDRVEECLRYPLPDAEVQVWLKTLGVR
jgi:hypothetical protein